MVFKLFYERTFLLTIDGLCCFDDFKIVAVVFSCLDKCIYIFWETASSISDTCMEKLISNTLITSDGFCNMCDISTSKLCKVCNLVDKTELCSKKGICCILGNLGAWYICPYEWHVASAKWFIDLFHHLFCLLWYYSADDSIWNHEVLYSCPFSEKLRIWYDIKIYVCLSLC